MRHRSPARFLAPLALVTCAVAVYAVVDHELGSDGKASNGTTSTTSKSKGTGTGTTSTTRKTTGKAKTYTVKSGDVLSAIAEKTGTTVTALQTRNPDIDASALRPGQKLKLP
jgi:LysM repeat protein